MYNSSIKILIVFILNSFIYIYIYYTYYVTLLERTENRFNIILTSIFIGMNCLFIVTVLLH